MTQPTMLAPFRAELTEALDDLLERDQSAQAPLVAEHLRSDGEMTAGPLCLALADALGVARGARRNAGLTTALVEAAVAASRRVRLESERANGALADVPLALNSADALYSLAQLSLLDVAADSEDARTAWFEALSLAVWRAEAEDEDGVSTAQALGRLAGAVAARAARLAPEAVSGVAEFAADAALRLRGGEPPGLDLTRLDLLDAAQRRRIAAIIR